MVGEAEAPAPLGVAAGGAPLTALAGENRAGGGGSGGLTFPPTAADDVAADDVAADDDALASATAAAASAWALESCGDFGLLGFKAVRGRTDRPP